MSRNLFAVRNLLQPQAAVVDLLLHLLPAGLEHISISRCNYVSNVGFSLLLLSPLPHLKRIVVRKCPGVTEDGLREIAAKKVTDVTPVEHVSNGK